MLIYGLRNFVQFPILIFGECRATGLLLALLGRLFHRIKLTAMQELH